MQHSLMGSLSLSIMMMVMLCVSAEDECRQSMHMDGLVAHVRLSFEQQAKTRKQASNEASQGAKGEKGKERKEKKRTERKKHDKQEEQRQDSLRCIYVRVHLTMTLCSSNLSFSLFIACCCFFAHVVLGCASSQHACCSVLVLFSACS